MDTPSKQEATRPGLWTNAEAIEKIILRSMNEGVIALECGGNIHTVNPAALRILNLDERETLGKPYDRVFSTDSQNEAFLDVFRRVIHQGIHTLHEELRFRRPDGQTVDLAVASSFLDFDACEPGTENMVVVFRDVTAFKSLERARRKAADHLSHELKTPLAIIQASVEILTRHNHDGPRDAKLLERIHRNFRRLTDIQAVVEEILNPYPFKPRPFLAAPLIDEVLGRIRHDASHRSVMIRTMLDELEPDFIDPYVLSMAVETLVKNAIENTPDGGEVVVSFTQIPEGALLRVDDSGVGIPLGEQEFIFDGFHHTQPTEEYSSKKPYDFGAGGKGLELLRLKALSETCAFEVSFESRRCNHVAAESDECPGTLASCSHIRDPGECREAGGSVFSVRFRRG